MIRQYVKACIYNSFNTMKYGFNAPKYCERLWVNPGKIEMRMGTQQRLKSFGVKNVRSGKVVGGDWWKVNSSYDKSAPYKRWVLGESWEQTGAYDLLMKNISERGQADGCKTFEDVVNRYKKLDDAFYEIKKMGRFKTSEEISGKKRFIAKGFGDIEVMIGKNGEVIHGCGGNHRLTIAKILELKVIPVKIGAVHPEGIKYLKQYRKNLLPEYR